MFSCRVPTAFLGVCTGYRLGLGVLHFSGGVREEAALSLGHGNLRPSTVGLSQGNILKYPEEINHGEHGRPQSPVFESDLENGWKGLSGTV